MYSQQYGRNLQSPLGNEVVRQVVLDRLATGYFGGARHATRHDAIATADKVKAAILSAQEDGRIGHMDGHDAKLMNCLTTEGMAMLGFRFGVPSAQAYGFY